MTMPCSRRHARTTLALAITALGALVASGHVRAETIFLVARPYDAELPAEDTSEPIDFDDTTIDPYGGAQDPGTAVVERLDGGRTLRIAGNGWKKIDLEDIYGGPVEVTARTILEFDFASGTQGEIHGIGLDNDASAIDPALTFQLYGTQTWGLQDHHDYDPAQTADGWKHYEIAIGEHYTGSFAMLFFSNDDDADDAGESLFRNVKIHDPATTLVPMWGFAADRTCYETDGAICDVPATSPGPAIVVGPNDDTLTIRLINLLAEPVSLVIPGQELPDFPAGTTPVWTDGSEGPRGDDTSKRVRSFTREAAPRGGKRTYRWSPATGNALRPGTYLYHSGTHPGVQVQMGLYGALRKNAGTGRVAYTTPQGEIRFQRQIDLVYAEIDADFHRAVAAGEYGPRRRVTSPLHYEPDYYLINGAPYDPSDPESQHVHGLRTGRDTLLRFYNAGLEAHAPTLREDRLTAVAEDGRAYSFARDQASVFLAPLKTADAVLRPVNPGTSALYDLAMGLRSAGRLAGGMVVFLDALTPGVIDFHAYDIVSYGGPQDVAATYEIRDGGETLMITGNGWKKIDLGYTVTADTVLEFDFRSTSEGEIHGIGFDDDDVISESQTFELYGTQIWGIQDHHDYDPADGWKHYVISAGELATGGPLWLTFTMDHDVDAPSGVAMFRRVKVYER